MNGFILALILMSLLWLQLLVGPFGFFGWDWSLCGLLVLSLRMRSPAYPLTAVGLGLLRDVFSIVPLGAQALGLGITATLVHSLGNRVLLEDFWIQGTVFFIGYLVYQVVFYMLGRIFGFLDGGFWQTFVWAIPKAACAATCCCLVTLLFPRFLRDRSEF